MWKYADFVCVISFRCFTITKNSFLSALLNADILAQFMFCFTANISDMYTVVK